MNMPWINHPGFYIREEMEARNWLQRDLAFVLGCKEQAVTMLLNGKRGISPGMAKALGHAFDVPAEFFANLQKAYDLSRAEEPEPDIAARATIQNKYPLREMIKRGWIEESDATLLRVQLARFFDVSDPDEIPYLAHAAKKTSYEDREITPEQLAWLFRVKQISKSIGVQKYSEGSLRESLTRLKTLLYDPEEARHVPRLMMECGVRFVIVETLPKSKIDGVCFWLDAQSPVIGMSIRFDRIDNFWFVLRHEIEHVLQKDGHENEVVDVGLEGDRAGVAAFLPEEERIANTAAGDFCVPQQKLDSFIARKRPFFYERDVLSFAKILNVHPGIVVGQMQRRLDRWDYLRKYQVKIRHAVLPGAIADGWGRVLPVSL
jgi:HTH-type transcriptional regulator / antitoxin HigA